MGKRRKLRINVKSPLRKGLEKIFESPRCSKRHAMDESKVFELFEKQFFQIIINRKAGRICKPINGKRCKHRHCQPVFESVFDVMNTTQLDLASLAIGGKTVSKFNPVAHVMHAFIKRDS